MWTVFLGAAYYFEDRLEREKIFAVAVGQARALARLLADARSWNASHGGVYVELSPGAPPNPLLDPERRDLVAVDGRHLTMINPSYMIRQLGEISARYGIELRLTSEEPVRPDSYIDAWEHQALAALAAGSTEYAAFIVDSSGTDLFRYMAPVRVEPSCRNCHCSRDYAVGDLRGGTSITLPAADVVLARRAFTRTRLLATAILWVLGVVLAIVVARGYRKEMRHAQHLEELALEDPLTGLHNRRGFLLLAERQLRLAERSHRPMLLLFADLDGLKSINDRYGHRAGDDALRQAGKVMSTAFRASDILARLGGDEFAALLPETGADGVAAARAALHERAEEIVVRERAPWRLCFSVGVVVFNPAAPVSLNELLASADAKMYEDKASHPHPRR
ncbi:MAG: diguanylate cyclase [Deltaproteobacteria bacterium]|nr:diguanylate cyclase [Deltaproteobacteria bacterium]